MRRGIVAAHSVKERSKQMDDPLIKIVSAGEARRVLTAGGIRDEVAFQNDINTLLARLEEKTIALRALSPPPAWRDTE
jgi:hypothetical protein